MRTYEPVLIRAAVVGIATAILHVLVVMGYLPIAPEAEVAIAGVFDAIGLAIVAFWSRAAVVPVAKLEDALASDSLITPSGEVIESSPEGVEDDESTGGSVLIV